MRRAMSVNPMPEKKPGKLESFFYIRPYMQQAK